MKRKSPLGITILRPQALSPKHIQEICDIYLKHHNIQYEDCLKRIQAGFDQIILYMDKEVDKVVGFNGITKEFKQVEGYRKQILAIYFGQLFIEKAYRKYYPLQKATMKIILKEMLIRPWVQPVIWADALTYKPYLLIAKNSKDFYPRPNVDTPLFYQELMHKLGQERYGKRYDPTTGCVKKDGKLIKDHVAPISPRMMSNQYIRFYAEKNTDYDKGNGMLIMTPYTWNTVYGSMKKISGQWMRMQKKKYASTNIFNILKPAAKHVL